LVGGKLAQFRRKPLRNCNLVQAPLNVRSWHLCDVPSLRNDVCSWRQLGHCLPVAEWPSLTDGVEKGLAIIGEQ
jgi:hypothetical protein